MQIVWPEIECGLGREGRNGLPQEKSQDLFSEGQRVGEEARGVVVSWDSCHSRFPSVRTGPF